MTEMEEKEAAKAEATGRIHGETRMKCFLARLLAPDKVETARTEGAMTPAADQSTGMIKKEVRTVAETNAGVHGLRQMVAPAEVQAQALVAGWKEPPAMARAILRGGLRTGTMPPPVE